MRHILMLSLLAAGCTDAGSEAERRYEMVKRTGTNGEICDAAREVASTYLRDGDEENYRWWHTISGVNCTTANHKGRDALPETRDHNEAIDEAHRSMEAMEEAAAHAADSPIDE